MEDFKDYLNYSTKELAEGIAKQQGSLLRLKLENIAFQASEDNNMVLKRLLDILAHHVRYNDHESIRETLAFIEKEGYIFDIENISPTYTITNNDNDLLVHARVHAPILTLKGILYKA